MIIANERLSVANPGALAMPGNAAVRSQTIVVNVHQHLNADMRGAMTFPEFVSQFKGYVDSKALDASATAVATSAKVMPARFAKYEKLGT